MKQENIARRIQKEESQRIYGLMATKSSRKALERFKTPAYLGCKVGSKE